MKGIQKLSICLFLILVYTLSASAQKMMMLDKGLKANSQPMESKHKGAKIFGSYQFGPYKIVSGKAGLITTKSKSKLLSFETNTESKRKSSFVFVANDKDSVIVNAATNTTAKETSLGNWALLNESKDNYIVLISPINDTAEWKMVVIFDLGIEVEGTFKSEGKLTDGIVNIEIRAIKQWEDGETASLKKITGYEFYLENQAIAAVQASMGFGKKFVWIDQNLSEHMKLVLAAASSSLIVYVDEQNSKP